MTDLPTILMAYEDTLKILQENFPEDVYLNASTDLKTTARHENLMVELFQFSYVNLEAFSERFKIKPSLIYLTNELKFSAEGGHDHGFFFIKIPKHLILRLFELIDPNEWVMKLDLDYVKLNLNFLANNFLTLQGMMKESVNKFVFFHEKCHMIHRRKLKDEKGILGLNLDSHDKSKFSIFLHCLELNADQYATYELLDNLVTFYIHKYYKATRDRKGVRLILICVLSSVFVLFTLLFKKRIEKAFYTDQGSHPHPVIRILEVSKTVVSELNNSLPYVFQTFEEIEPFDYKDIFEECLFVTSQITSKEVGFDIKNEFFDILNAKETEINSYLKLMEDYSKTESVLFRRGEF